MSRAPAPHVFLVAGEDSGDRLGAALIAAIKRRSPGARFSGVGGAQMAGEGVPSLFPLGDLAIIGIAAIPESLPKIVKRIRQTADAVIAAKPDVLVIIDSPEFTHRVARRVRARTPKSRSSIMSVRRCGRGGRAARAPCALTSIMCWRCCRSSRRRCGGWAGRLAPSSDIR